MTSVVPQDDPQLLILTTYVSEKMKRDLVELSQANDRSIAAEMRIALRAHIEREAART